MIPDSATGGTATPVIYVMPPQVYAAFQVLEFTRAMEWGRCVADAAIDDRARTLTAQEELTKAAALDVIADWLTGRRAFDLPQRPQASERPAHPFVPPPQGACMPQ